MSCSLNLPWLLAAKPFGIWKIAKNQWYANQTVVHPVGLTMLITTCMAILCLPRRWATGAALLMPCFVSAIQQVTIFNLDFTFTRILVITFLFRVLIRGEYRNFNWHKMDSLMVAWAIIKICCYSVTHANGSALIFMLGQTIDTACAYFVLRLMVRDWGDILAIGRAYAITAVLVSVFFVIEYNTRRNIFSVFGGVPEITIIRQGKLRCQGPFAHPIVAGCFWASLLPWFYGMMKFDKRLSLYAVPGAIASVIIIFTCSSSTPVFGGLMALFAVAFWKFRKYTYTALKGLVVLLVLLHIAMEAPVWHLLARVSAVGGSTGWHRYQIIDQAIRRFTEWAATGTRSTAHWGHQTFDLTNQFVLEGVRGGFVTLVLFVAILVVAFRSIDRVIRLVWMDKRKQMMAWCLGACLVTHIANFFGVSYFGQITLVLYVNLAAIASIHQHCKREARQAQLAQYYYQPQVQDLSVYATTS